MQKFTDSEVRWGILGVGNVCEVKSAPAMNLIPNSKLVAVMR
ncbi:MAG: gfo/Idh/MocA family oxidoreductase, partial [Algoriphagus sp.]|nr:gfo/Idh/MocA family oxidoreductase [Algoriphagus sp.]